MADPVEDVPYITALTTYLSFLLLYFFGHLRDTSRILVIYVQKKLGLKTIRKVSDDVPEGYAPLCKDYEDFYTRRLYHRMQDCFNRPIASAPDAYIDVCLRETPNEAKARGEIRCSTLNRTGNTRQCLNLGSYNYLGFGSTDEYCTQRVIESVRKYKPSMASSRAEAGTTDLHEELEKLVAQFVGKPAAITYGMGFATNSFTIPALVGKGSLIVSDALNHSSIVSGARGSGATVKVFRHNDAAHLEQTLRKQISEGQPRTHRPWKKILVIVEGIYSMEGEICKLKEIVAVTKKYKAYVYLDEAHSIGALGKTGRGVCEQCGVDPADIDIMMGTFTKSFGSVGGYIAASEEIVEHIKQCSPAHLYASSMSPPCVEQVISSMKVIMGKDGSNRGEKKLRDLKDNSNWFRMKLASIGCQVLGDEDSPVMPVMLYQPAKIAAFSRECFKLGVAVVVVCFPATPLLLSRARVCISASHTREDLQKAFEIIKDVATRVGIRYGRTSAVHENNAGGLNGSSHQLKAKVNGKSVNGSKTD
mmetsp:Transcript_8213/g.30300  ORF Transcript_8213/g.30300 Transcript_8213/m.30300 type:complete len:532 (-) Transcript_8213:89-1684(-)